MLIDPDFKISNMSKVLTAKKLVRLQSRVYWSLASKEWKINRSLNIHVFRKDK